ncbi:hypothetical protein TRAPUB_1486, partial [Trametes pubescens]
MDDALAYGAAKRRCEVYGAAAACERDCYSMACYPVRDATVRRWEAAAGGRSSQNVAE